MKKLSLLFRNPIVKKRLTILLVMLVGIFPAMLATALTLSSTPTFCSFCHEMKEDHLAWSRSSHKNVTCIACHTPPNVVGFLQHKMTAVPELYLHIADAYEKPINKESETSKEIGNEECDQCHKMATLKVTPSPGIIINHKVHADKGITCAACHNRVAHPDMKAYENFLTMDGCFRCHGLDVKAKAPGKCEACHTKDFDLKPANHKQPNWVPPEHSKQAKVNKKNCKTCHQESFCTNCHGMEMPHPKDNWTKGKKVHATVGKSKPDSCRKCHAQQDFCSSCHHKGYDSTQGPWIKAHPNLVRATGASACFECHGPTYCAYCHVRGQKPASIKGP